MGIGNDFVMNKASDKKISIDKSIGLIFDMDGTLIDTAKATVPACQEIARQLKMPVAQSEAIRKTIGWSEQEFYKKLYPEQDSQLLNQYGVLVEAYEAQLIEAFGADLVFPGIFELLEFLTANGNYLAIASTGSVSHVDVVMKSTGLAKYFSVIKCDEPVKTAMVSQIIHDGNGCRWIMIGDKAKDATAASENGIISIGVQFGYGTEDELRSFTYTAKNTEDIISLINDTCR